MKLASYGLLTLLLSAACFGSQPSGLLRQHGDWIPYVDRVRPDEILLIERQLNDPPSERSNLSIYIGDSDSLLHLVYSLRDTADGFEFEIISLPEDGPNRRRKRIHLPQDIAQKLTAVFETVLTKQVYPIAPVGSEEYQKIHQGDQVWIFLRKSKSEAALGKVAVPYQRCWTGAPDNNLAFMEVLYRLQGCFGWRGTGGAPLAELDIALNNLKATYSN